MILPVNDLNLCSICKSPVHDIEPDAWFYRCENNPDCRGPALHPRKREVDELSAQLLDRLESDADMAQDHLSFTEIDHTTLRALIDAARRDLDAK